MASEITVSFPLNSSEQEKDFFEPYLKYHLLQQRVLHLKNIFVTSSGLCLNKRGLVKECHHNNPDQYQDFMAEAARHYRDVQRNPENLIQLDNKVNYLLVHHPWYNYYHWICECIFRACMVKDQSETMVLLLPEYYRNTDFVISSLEIFSFKGLYFIPGGKSAMVKNLCLPQIKPIIDSYDCKMVRSVKYLFLKTLEEKNKPVVNLGERIYISRAKAAKKKVLNEEDLLPILQKFGFVVIYNEDLTFWEQVSGFSNAKYLISIHGSGLTNMLFMKEGASILEFRKRVSNANDWYSPVFWYFAESLGYRYFQQNCEPADESEDYFSANYIVDIQLFEKNLSLMIK